MNLAEVNPRPIGLAFSSDVHMNGKPLGAGRQTARSYKLLIRQEDRRPQIRAPRLRQ